MAALVSGYRSFTTNERGTNDRLCAGFRTPATTISPHALAAGVRKAPTHEIAGSVSPSRAAKRYEDCMLGRPRWKGGAAWREPLSGNEGRDMNPANLLTKWHWIVELARKKKSLTSESRMVSPAARIN